MNATEFFLVSVVLVALVFEAFTLWDSKIPTISVALADASKRYPIIAFALGVLAGHWFWPL